MRSQPSVADQDPDSHRTSLRRTTQRIQTGCHVVFGATDLLGYMVRMGPTLTKDAIVATATTLGCERGEDGLTMRAIADRLGTSATALYQHFESKTDILNAIRLAAMRQFNEYLEPAFAHQNHASEFLRVMWQNYVRFAVENPWLYQLLFVAEETDYDNAPAEEVHEIFVRPRQRVQTVLRGGVEAGVLRKDLDIERVPMLLWSAIHGCACLVLTGRLRDKHPMVPLDGVPALVDTMADTFLNGIASRVS